MKSTSRSCRFGQHRGEVARLSRSPVRRSAGSPPRARWRSRRRASSCRARAGRRAARDRALRRAASPRRSRPAGSRGRAPGRCTRRASAAAVPPGTGVLVDARRGHEAIVMIASRSPPSSPSSAHAARRAAPVRTPRPAIARAFVDRLLGRAALVAEIQQRRQQVVAQLILGRSAPPACPARLQRRRQPILQLQPDPLGGLLADAGNRGQPRDVLRRGSPGPAPRARCPTAPPAPASDRCR